MPFLQSMTDQVTVNLWHARGGRETKELSPDMSIRELKDYVTSEKEISGNEEIQIVYQAKLLEDDVKLRDLDLKQFPWIICSVKEERKAPAAVSDELSVVQQVRQMVEQCIIGEWHSIEAFRQAIDDDPSLLPQAVIGLSLQFELPGNMTLALVSGILQFSRDELDYIFTRARAARAQDNAEENENRENENRENENRENENRENENHEANERNDRQHRDCEVS